MRGLGITAEGPLDLRLAVVATLLAVVLSCIGAGCGSGSVQNGDVKLTVATKGTAEEVVLGEIYAQALEAVGYKVKRKLTLPAGLPPFERKGLRISGYPESLILVLKDITRFKHPVPGDSAKAYRLAVERLEPKGLTAFPPTSYSRSKAVGMLRTTAEERGLSTLSELKGPAKRMTLAAGSFCFFLTDCIVGLDRFYGIHFKSFASIEPVARYKVLETGKTDASMLLSTEGRLAGKKSRFVILEDDKHRMPAGNMVWVTTQDVVDEAGPDYEKAIVDAQKGLTLKLMQEFDARVKFKNESPAKVAAEYLKSIHDGGQARL